VEAKFLGNAVLALPRDQAERVVKGVDGLRAGAPLGELLAALAPSGAAMQSRIAE
jgi:hypothetical protein